MPAPSDLLKEALDAQKVLQAVPGMAEEDMRMQFDLGMWMLRDALQKMLDKELRDQEIIKQAIAQGDEL